MDIAGRLPEKLRKNRLACRITETETDTDLYLKKSTPLKKLVKKHTATN